MTPYEKTLEYIVKLPTKIYGLKYLPSILPFANNNTDDCLFGWPSNPEEVSEGNRDVVYHCLTRIGPRIKSIMEIGVHRNGTESMSYILMKKKPDKTFYVGVDIEDKAYLNNAAENIFTLQSNSHDQAYIRQNLQILGIDKIDLLMIDGWHSINACVNDWMYVDMLSDTGIVMMHDSNFHPGPIALFDAIDESIFNKERHCTSDDDKGIAIAWKK